MKYPQNMLFSEELASDDEIDSLFEQLQVIEPPPSLVDRILTSVARLPYPSQNPSLPADKTDYLLVRHDMCKPS